MKRKCLEKAECAIARALDTIGDWWSLLIIRDAFLGRRRFSEFQTGLGVAKNILTVRLQKLVDRGILEKIPAADGSAYQEYVLTEKGRGLDIVLIALRQWGERCLYEADEPCRVRTSRESKRVAPTLTEPQRQLHSATVRVVAATGE